MAEKERVNECRDELMQEAMDSIAQMAPAEYAAEIEKYQQRMLASLATQSCAQELRTTAANDDQYEILCGGCYEVSNYIFYIYSSSSQDNMRTYLYKGFEVQICNKQK